MRDSPLNAAPPLRADDFDVTELAEQIHAEWSDINAAGLARIEGAWLAATRGREQGDGAQGADMAGGRAPRAGADMGQHLVQHPAPRGGTRATLGETGAQPGHRADSRALLAGSRVRAPGGLQRRPQPLGADTPGQCADTALAGRDGASADKGDRA